MTPLSDAEKGHSHERKSDFFWKKGVKKWFGLLEEKCSKKNGPPPSFDRVVDLPLSELIIRWAG